MRFEQAMFEMTYLDEFSFRYNHRGQNLPVVMFAKVGTLSPKVGKTGS